MNGPFYVGVDQSLTSPGVAVLNEAGQPLFAGTLSVARDMRGGERLAHIAGSLELLLRPYAHGIMAAALEGASYGSTHREFDLGEVSGIVRAHLYTLLHKEPFVVPPTVLKLYATGNGLATKEDVLHVVKTVYGHDFGEENDVADAFVLARISRAMFHPKILSRRCELEAIRSLKSPPKAKPRASNRRSL